MDSLSSKLDLFPNNDNQWTVLRSAALADGMTDAAFNLAIETRRPDSEQSALWKTRWTAAIQRALDEIEARILELNSELNIAHIATFSALSYLELRRPDLLALNQHPKTKDWITSFKQHSFAIQTVFLT